MVNSRPELVIVDDCRIPISYAIILTVDVTLPDTCLYEAIDIDGITAPFDASPANRHDPN